MWDRALVGRSWFPPLPPRDTSSRWHIQYGDPQGITGMIFTDGACRRVWYWPESARAGWGFAQLAEHGVATLVYGALPGPMQTSPRAEMFAFFQALQVCVLPVTVCTDFKGLIDGLALGPKWCLAPRRNNLDLWEAIWGKISDLGGLHDTLRVQHVKGHQRGPETFARGNRWADLAATKGRDLHCASKDARKAMTIANRNFHNVSTGW